MLALWRWPCALIALLLSGFGGLRSLPADDRSSDEAERVVVSRPAAQGTLVATASTVLAGALATATVLPRQTVVALPAPVAAPAWRPVTCQRRGSAGGARAP